MKQDSSSNTDLVEEPKEDAKRFYRLLKGIEHPAYLSSISSKLSAMVKLLHIKSVG